MITNVNQAADCDYSLYLKCIASIRYVCWLCAVTAWHGVLCLLCNKTFRSLHCYRQHHKHAHLLEFEHECLECGLSFLSRHSFKIHHCLPQRRRVNFKKREVLATRMQEKMQLMSEPYFVFVDSHNQVVAGSGDSETSIKEICLERSLQINADTTRTSEADSNNSVDRLENDDTSGGSILQNDPFQLTENSEAVLSCLPQSAMVQAELEMDVCDTLRLAGGRAQVEQSASDVYDADENLLADAAATFDDDGGGGSEKVAAANGAVLEHIEEQESSSSFHVGAEPPNGGNTADDPGGRQRWPMATLLDNGRLRCNVCHKELRVSNYYPHMRRVHKMPSSQSRPITWKVCDRCGYQCQDNYKLRRHAMKHTRFGQFSGRSCTYVLAYAFISFSVKITGYVSADNLLLPFISVSKRIHTDAPKKYTRCTGQV